MNKYGWNCVSFIRWTSILSALFLTIFVSFYFFNVSAQTDVIEKSAEQNLVNGRLAFSKRSAPFPEGFITTSNPNGSDQGNLPISSLLTPTEPAWSPDGAKIAFASIQSPADIYVINVSSGEPINLTNTGTSFQERNPSWSVTGKIAYERDPDTVNGQIWTMNADGSGQARFSAITQSFPSNPAWSPDGTKLAFKSGFDIWVINADGTNERRVTVNSTSDSDPAWSPDGTKIVFRKGGGIGVINADGTNEAIIAASGNAPAWSPDGTKIAFSVSGEGSGLYIMDPNGANQTRIVANIINFPNCCDIAMENPAWQPVAQSPNSFNITGRVLNNNLPVSGATVNLSGTTNAAAITDAAGNYQFSGLAAGGNYTVSPSLLRHYFTPANRSFNNLTSNQTGNFEVLGVCQNGNCVRNGKIAFTRDMDIFTMNADGTNQTNITNTSTNDTDPNYSPDGAKIAFTTNRDGNNEIYRMNQDGTNSVRLTNNSASDVSPYYSPDGASIVFISDRDGNREVYKMNADGTNQMRLTNDAALQSVPAFSPDGGKIIFTAASSASTAPNQLWTMNADGSNQQQFTNPNTTNYYNRPSYSPNGQKIIFVYGDDITAQNIFTMNADGTNRARLTNGRSSPQYSPDGSKIVRKCCFSTIAEGIYTDNADGNPGSSQRITTGQFDDLPDWQPIAAPRPASFDYDGDSRSDVSVFRPAEGIWYLNRSTAGFTSSNWGLSSDVLVPADYDGDLKTDLAVWRPSNGGFYILNSFDNTLRAENFGLAGDIPTGGDFDGDGKADLAVYRSGAQGAFYYRASMGNPQGSVTTISWGTSGDKAVVGDYDGDGRADAAVFRPSNGTWYIRQSANGQLLATGFGSADDKLVPADFDADGKTDLAVYRGGNWYVLRSAQGFTAFQFGVSTDTPAPADYDGDGRADAAVFRNGVWYLNQSTAGFNAVSFGQTNDRPISAAFVR